MPTNTEEQLRNFRTETLRSLYEFCQEVNEQVVLTNKDYVEIEDLSAKFLPRPLDKKVFTEERLSKEHRDFLTRNGFVLFLQNGDVVKRHDRPGGGKITLWLYADAWNTFMALLSNEYQTRLKSNELIQEKLAESESVPLHTKTLAKRTAEQKHLFGNLKWEGIQIKFIDGNYVKISGKNTKPVTVHYKEMGFEDARDRKPNQQWEFLRLFAMRGGEFSRDDSEAKDTLKKKKQLLSKTLRNYFGIKGDPFYPYKENSSYRIKINLTPESDLQ